jgi:hypothetical protein
MDDDMNRLSYLWDGSQPHWALLPVGNDGAYLIVNTADRVAKLIENDHLAKRVIAQMQAAGVRVLPAGFRM